MTPLARNKLVAFGRFQHHWSQADAEPMDEVRDYTRDVPAIDPYAGTDTAHRFMPRERFERDDDE